MEKFLTKTVNTLLIPILLLDFFSGIIGFIWLAMLSEWGIIIAGVIYLIIGAFIISIFLLPSLALAAPMLYFHNRQNTLGAAFFGFLSVSYVALLIYFSFYSIFVSYTETLAPGTSLLPFLLWGYAIATAPWAYMASKEDESATGTFISLFFSKLGLFVVLVLSGFFAVELEVSFGIFAMIMVVEVIVATTLAVIVMDEEKKYSLSNQNSDYIETEYEITSNNSEGSGQIVNKDNFEIGSDSSFLILGESGTGKSELVRSLINNLKNDYEPKDINFVIFDLKHVEFQDEDIAYLHKDIITDPKQGVGVLKELNDLANLRIKKGEKFPAIVIYVEECDMAVQYKKLFNSTMNLLLNKARDANFCIIYSTSRVSEDTISYDLLKKFEVLLVSKLPESSTQYLGVAETDLLNNYEFMKYNNQDIERHTNPTSQDNHRTLVKKAVKLIHDKGKASTALFQTELHIGYGAAAKVMEELEEIGLVGPAQGSKPREVYFRRNSR